MDGLCASVSSKADTYETGTARSVRFRPEADISELGAFHLICRYWSD